MEFKSYLSKRNQIFNVNDTESDPSTELVVSHMEVFYILFFSFNI